MGLRDQAHITGRLLATQHLASDMNYICLIDIYCKGEMFKLEN